MTRIVEEPTPEEAVSSGEAEPSAEVRAWQEQRIAERLRAADAGRFATGEAVRAVVRKYVPNG